MQNSNVFFSVYYMETLLVRRLIGLCRSVELKLARKVATSGGDLLITRITVINFIYLFCVNTMWLCVKSFASSVVVGTSSA